MNDPTMPTDLPVAIARLDEVVSLAQQQFWATVAAGFPQARTGDLTPDTSVELSVVMFRAVAEWLALNHAPMPPHPALVSDGLPADQCGECGEVH